MATHAPTSRMPRRLILLLLFVPSYAFGQFVAAVVGAFALGWWDPKFGSPWGNVVFQLQLLPLFLVPALIGHGLGLAVVWGHLPRVIPRPLAVREFLVGLLSPCVIGAAWYVAARGLPDTLVARVIEAVDLGWLVIVPALLTVLVHRQSDRATSPAARAEQAG